MKFIFKNNFIQNELITSSNRKAFEFNLKIPLNSKKTFSEEIFK